MSVRDLMRSFAILPLGDRTSGGAWLASHRHTEAFCPGPSLPCGGGNPFEIKLSLPRARIGRSRKPKNRYCPTGYNGHSTAEIIC